MRNSLAYFSAALLIGSVGTLSAAAAPLFTDNFDSGVSGSNWALVNAGQSMLVGDSAHAFGAQSAKQVNAFTDGVSDVYYMKTQAAAFTNPGPIQAGMKEIATVQFWDDNIRTDASGDGPINIAGGLMLAGDHASTDFYQLGVNSAVSVNNYFWRTQAQGSFATAIPRTQGWHELRIEAFPYTGSNDVQFFIDGVLAATGNRRVAGPVDMNEIRLGISVRTPDSPFWFDNVSLEVVPEPASAILLALGSLVLGSFAARSRRAMQH
jgi:hypothetical protein